MVIGRTVTGARLVLAVLVIVAGGGAITGAITYDEKMEAISNAVKIYNENRRDDREKGMK